MYVAFTIIVGDTHAVVFTIIAPINNTTYVYIVRIHMFVKGMWYTELLRGIELGER